MSETFYIVGPTGVGKSELAAEVAHRLNAEIIGADAFQIYEGFPLLTAKPDAATLRRTPHHLIGVTSPTEEYNVARYLEAATQRREQIWRRGRLALVVGGTGLYVKALTHGLSPLPAAHPELRAELETLDLPALNARLMILDPLAAEFIDQKNKRRLMRAIEVCLTGGGRFPISARSGRQTPAFRGVLLFRQKDELHARIDRRVDAIFRNGVIEEVRGASQSALSVTAGKMIGLEAIRQVLAGRLSVQEAQVQISLATRQYAKRQATWFKREKSFMPINLTSCATFEDAVNRIICEIGPVARPTGRA